LANKINRECDKSARESRVDVEFILYEIRPFAKRVLRRWCDETGAHVFPRGCVRKTRRETSGSGHVRERKRERERERERKRGSMIFEREIWRSRSRPFART